MSGSRRVFSIPSGAPFLPTLAEALLHGRLVPGFRFNGDPLALADATIYVPTVIQRPCICMPNSRPAVIALSK
ncbi:MAG: hypothetical protein EOS53_28675 [Mesorhizobium sp.]|nr:MAG: hypothetical protein EOS53_28675 [Mesorhizobium sp.]